MRYPRDLRDNPQAIASDVLVPMPGGGAVPLGEVAKVDAGARADHRSAPRTGSLRPTSMSISATATSAAMSPTRSRRSQASIQFPPGYYVMWSGQYEYLERADARLKIVVPVTLLIIFLLLYLNFRSHHRDADRHAVAAVRAGRRALADVVARLQPVGRGRRRLHRARRRRRRDRRRDADLSQSGAGGDQGAARSRGPRPDARPISTTPSWKARSSACGRR